MRNIDINNNEIKTKDWIRDAGMNESDRQIIRKQMCGKVLYVDEHIIVVKPLSKKFKRIYGEGSVVFDCKRVLIVSQEERQEIMKWFNKEE